MKWLRRSFVALLVGWTVALPAAAVLRGTSDPGLRAQAPVLLVYGAGAVLCHQRTERSFHLSGAPLPVCARCTGIYAGAAVAAIGLVIAAAVRRERGRALTPAALRMLFVAVLAPTAATLVYEWASGTMPSHIVRAAAGAPVGAFVAWTVLRQTRADGYSG